ncbi:hypothetical protein FC82_GL002744 [Secundilactobacillus collinoides DSM 20515 = JCM 1123]|uniref:Uncharacterized protein n=1 Tax=Secundilactobacillus collinoides DSM 20515 = JCM 1123 TaxID=1423733 RepID=A0A0R2B614_SECCO|nr:hypothetical protein FC82_GL002744 [Secundilactobacillus collinoides DSM 20515 = JCM 1123]
MAGKIQQQKSFTFPATIRKFSFYQSCYINFYSEFTIGIYQIFTLLVESFT